MKDLLSLRVDGADCREDWPLDRGLQYGDGLFETMVVRAGRVRFRSLHQQRLATGCGRLGIALDAAPAWDEVDRAARAAGAATLKLHVTRGNALERGYTPTGRERSRRLLYVFAATETLPPGDPFRAVRLAVTLGENPLLAGLKHANRLEQVMARAEMRGSDASEGLLASSTGLLISGTMTNVFVCIDGEWVTPRLDRCGIAGVARAVVLREAQLDGHPVRECELPFTALDRCEELFVTNVRYGVQPVTHLDGRELKVGSWVAALQARVAQLDD